ncbi:hypothetical protein [Streptomyces antimicrobicus]|uniref:Integral membrane protein n=1 Tax=Streptomyces antimicrobicus TaxID=2883108 RepID=A0ABS8BE47_9ACTN|nr:hypothetical protein [Streptomyces antimicrobicus]MCB5182915.1 hypothetical protein [Streptomyces antimicrobicus]
MDTTKPGPDSATATDPGPAPDSAPTAAAPAPGTPPVAAADVDADAAAVLDADTDEDGATDLDGDGDPAEEFVEEGPTGVGSAASAVVAAGLGLVALSGTWVSRVLAERETLLGQIRSVDATSTQAKIEALYGNAWHMTALVNGLFSALALLLAVFVLLRPAFGAPGRVHPTWVKAVAWAGTALGALGLVVFTLMYFDVVTPLPTAG